MTLEQVSFKREDIEKGRIMSVLAYLSFLILVPVLISRENKFVMFHVRQGLALIVCSVFLWIVFLILDSFFYISEVNFCGFSVISFWANIFIIVMALLGIINAARGDAKRLPVIGRLGDKFNL